MNSADNNTTPRWLPRLRVRLTLADGERIESTLAELPEGLTALRDREVEAAPARRKAAGRR